MKKKIIFLMFTIFIGMLLIWSCESYATSETDDIVQSTIRRIYFGNRITVDEDQENLYFLYGYRLNRFSLENNTTTTIYTVDTSILNWNYASKNGIIYIYYCFTDDSGAYYYKIYRYNVLTDTELDMITLTDVEEYKNDLGDLVVDNNGYMYFRYGTYSCSLVSFDKEGNYVDKLEDNATTSFAMSYNTSYNDKVLFFTFPNEAGKYGYIMIDNGTFVDHTYHLNSNIWISLLFGDYTGDIEYSKWRYSEDGRYAIDHRGYIIELTYDETEDIGFTYELVFDTERGLVDYDYAGLFSGDYVYALGEDNETIIKFNLNTKMVEGYYKLQSSTLDGKEIVDFKVSNGKLYIFLRDEDLAFDTYYYVVTKDLEEDITEIENITVTTHESLTHSKEEIEEEYTAAISTYNYSNSIFDVEPSYTSPYNAGTLKDEVIQDTLNQLNFYRWLTGLNKVTINSTYMERSRKGCHYSSKT